MPRKQPDELKGADEEAVRLILAADLSKPGWRRRAVNTDRDTALAQIPADDAVAVIQTRMPVAAYRILQRHIHGSLANQAAWMREAIVDRYLREGGNPHHAAEMLRMKVDQRRHHVPRDTYGQPRDREGRKTGIPRSPW